MLIGYNPIETPWLVLNHVQCRLRGFSVKSRLTTCMNMSTTREMLFYASKPLYTYFSRQLLERLPFLLSVFFPFYRLRCVFHVSRSGAPCRCDFPMQRYSVCPVVKYRCVLSCSRIERQPSANHRFGYSAKFLTVYLPFTVLSLLLEPHVKSIPKRRPKGSIRGKKKV